MGEQQREQRQGAAAAAGEFIISLGTSHHDTDLAHAKVEVIVIDDDDVIVIDEEEEVVIIESEEASNVSIHLKPIEALADAGCEGGRGGVG